MRTPEDRGTPKRVWLAALLAFFAVSGFGSWASLMIVRFGWSPRGPGDVLLVGVALSWVPGIAAAVLVHRVMVRGRPGVGTTVAAALVGIVIGWFLAAEIVRRRWVPEAGLGVPVVILGPSLVLAVVLAVAAHAYSSRRRQAHRL